MARDPANLLFFLKSIWPTLLNSKAFSCDIGRESLPANTFFCLLFSVLTQCAFRIISWDHSSTLVEQVVEWSATKGEASAAMPGYEPTGPCFRSKRTIIASALRCILQNRLCKPCKSCFLFVSVSPPEAGDWQAARQPGSQAAKKPGAFFAFKLANPVLFRCRVIAVHESHIYLYRIPKFSCESPGQSKMLCAMKYNVSSLWRVTKVEKNLFMSHTYGRLCNPCSRKQIKWPQRSSSQLHFDSRGVKKYFTAFDLVKTCLWLFIQHFKFQLVSIGRKSWIFLWCLEAVVLRGRSAPGTTAGVGPGGVLTRRGICRRGRNTLWRDSHKFAWTEMENGSRWVQGNKI